MKTEDIIKENSKYYEKREIDIEFLIQQQESIIVELEKQLQIANVTLSELKGKK